MKTNRALLALALLTLLAALWAGLLRIGWPWPPLQPMLPAAHGPLMVSGFLGTLIALERAVALQKRAAYLVPLASGAGGLLLIGGFSWTWGSRLLLLGSVGLLLLFGVLLRRHRALHTGVMALGAAAWLLGNGLLALGWPIYRAAPWWLAFLVLTIAGERLELSRVLRLSARVRGLFVAATAVFLLALLLSLASYAAGMRAAGLGMLALAAWLLRYDIARRTIRRSGLTRYIAACLLSGYVWLGVGGVLALVYGGVAAGPAYDAILHAVFLGFVFAMIFGHAPIIFPAILGRPMAYRPIFYGHLALLHLSLVLRVLGDVAAFPALRRWGGLLNALVLLLFLANTAVALRATPKNGTRINTDDTD
ncbi:MAG: hypothetical protein KC425_03730 [Anaerolineales bacterium]|nr:hypothetical protein [Anaerolineales bacterium]